MIGSIFYLKGVASVPPKKLLETYREYAQKNKRPDTWNYHLITFRGPNASETARMFFELISAYPSKDKKNFSNIRSFLKQKAPDQKEPEVTFSEEFHLTDREISSPHKNILAGLSSGSISTPVKEFSKSENRSIYRIFFLRNHTPGRAVSFEEVEEQLKNDLIQKLADKELTAYVSQLREKYGVTDAVVNSSIPKNLQPFELK